MKPTIPQTLPKATNADLLPAIAHLGIDRAKHPIVFLTIDNYYERSNATTPDGENYDDAAFWLLPNGGLIALNATTDAEKSKHKDGKPIRCTGVTFAHLLGQHKDRAGNWGMIQRTAMVPYRRAPQPKTIYFGYIGLNAHHGGEYSTWSEGCTTAPKFQWLPAMDKIIHLAKILWGETPTPYPPNPKILVPRWQTITIPWVHLRSVGGRYLDIDGNPQPPKI